MFNAASVLLTEDCNLNCTYCFEDHTKTMMTKEVAEQTLQWAFKSAEEIKTDLFELTFFGGEPLLNPKILCFMVHRGYELSQERGIRIGFLLITNSTLLPQEVGDVIKEYEGRVSFNVQLSVDGIPEVQNMYRIKKDGESSMPMVLKNVPKWIEIFKNRPSDLNIHGCLNKNSLPYLYESYRYFKHELGIRQIWFIPVMEEDWDANDVEIYREQNQLIFDEIMKEFRETRDMELLREYAPMDKSLSYCDVNTGKPCGAGASYGCVTATGDIYPCHQFYFSTDGKQMKLGDIYNGVDKDRTRVFLEYDGGDLGCDPNCNHGNCYRCVAVNWELYGSIFKQKLGYYCALSKVDQEFQDKIREELEKMGIKNGNECEACSSHSPDVTNGCDVVSGGINEPDQMLPHPDHQLPFNDDTMEKMLLIQKRIVAELQDIRDDLVILKRGK